MIERWAMINNGLVENVCLWDGLLSTWQPPENITMIKAPDDVGIGWTYDSVTATWSAPVIVPEPPPEPLP